MIDKTHPDLTAVTMNDAMIQCRSWGHSWDRWSPPANAAPLYGVREYLRCTRCGTERHSIFSPITGERQDHLRYIYPDGYHSVRAATRSAWRAEAHRRNLIVAGSRETTRQRRKASSRA